MCGIFGFSELTPITRAIAPFLAYEMEDRGTDSWGGTDGNEVIRYVDSIANNFYVPESWTRGIFHTRAASVGAVTVDNAHPFTMTCGDRTLYGIHNGCVSNYASLNTKYGRTFEVDSMHIFGHLVEERDTSEISGWGACAYYDTTHPDRLNLFRFNCTNMHVVQLMTGEFVFGSTAAAVEKAVRWGGGMVGATFNLDSERLYYIRLDAEGEPEIYKGGPLPFGYRGGTNVRTFRPTTEDYSAWEGYGYGTGRNTTNGSGGTSGRVSFYPATSQPALVAATSFSADSNPRFSPSGVDNARIADTCLKCPTKLVNPAVAFCPECMSMILTTLDTSESANRKVVLPFRANDQEWLDLDACERECNFDEFQKELLEAM